MKKKILMGMMSMVLLCQCMVVSGQGKVVMIEGVPIMNQHPNMPTGCEATALAMLLRYYGVAISKEQIGKDMPKGNFYTQNGKTYGPHPNEAFLGSPFSTGGYGVYAPVICKLAEGYLPGRVEDLTGKAFEELLKCIDESRPVMIWATINMVPMKLTRSWYTSDGSLFTWKGNEHALVMVGYDDSYVYMNDPYTGKREKYDRKKVENRWASMGKQALAIKPAYTYKDAVINESPYPSLLLVEEEGVWIPARMLPTVTQDIEVKYEGGTGTVTVTRDGQPHEMPLANESNYYKLWQDTTYIQLNWAKKYLGIHTLEQDQKIVITGE
ncbi:MAG: C39 family peptidase [Cellulosilyticaceae bacterium]